MRKGDIIRLKSYEKFTDYRSHRGKLAKVIDDDGENELPWRIRWGIKGKGEVSYVSEKNVIVVAEAPLLDIEKTLRKFIMREEINGL